MATLYHIGRTPGQTLFGLDTFTEHYKAAQAADVVLTDPTIPHKGDAHPSYAFMFVTDLYCQETGPSASALDIVYTGCLRTSGGLPVLPPPQNTDGDQVMSATSSISNDGRRLTAPISAQFYAPTITYRWWTYNAKGAKGTASDPTRAVEIITITIGDSSFSYGSVGIGSLVAAFFQTHIADTIQSEEIVATGKFWQNTEQKVKALIPYTANITPGFYPSPYADGTGYVVGDTITLTFSGTCVMTVTAVTTPSGAILGTTIVSNSLSAATSTPVPVTGGSGTGASYTVIHVT